MSHPYSEGTSLRLRGSPYPGKSGNPAAVGQVRSQSYSGKVTAVFRNAPCVAVIGTFVVLALMIVEVQAQETYTHVEIADCHVHLLDFLQNGDFMVNGKFVRGGTGVRPRPGHRGQRIEAFLAMMDHANVSEAMVCGMPFVKKWAEDDRSRSKYYLHSSSAVVRARDTDREIGNAVTEFASTPERRKQLRRIHPFICGFDATDQGAVDFIVKIVKDYPGVFKGLGEIMSHHDDLTHLSLGERPRGDHPALFRIYDFAGEHGLPVSIHHNIAPVSVNGEFVKPLYLPELLHAFEEFPHTKFIWCHAGVSRRIHVKDLPGILAGILREHKDHLTIDLSWVVLPNYILKDPEAWRKLIADYPGNFMVGSDAVGSFRNYVSTIRAYDKLFGILADEELVRRVASRNFIELMPDRGLTLPQDYKYPEDRYIKR